MELWSLSYRMTCLNRIARSPVPEHTQERQDLPLRIMRSPRVMVVDDGKEYLTVLTMKCEEFFPSPRSLWYSRVEPGWFFHSKALELWNYGL